MSRPDCPPCPPCNPTPPRDAPAPRPRVPVKVPASAKPFQPAALSIPAKGPAVQTKSLQHGEILPVASYSLRGCCTKPTGAKTCNGPPRPGQVELVFPSRKDAAKFGVPLGPALQFCTGLRAGKIVPMKDPQTAKKVALAYADCMVQGGTVEACAVVPQGLAGLRSRRKPTRKKARRKAARRSSRRVRRR